MNNRRSLILRAIRGPILLITIGILFALHQAFVASIERTWPLLIIVLGVMILLERTAVPRNPAAEPPFQTADSGSIR